MIFSYYRKFKLQQYQKGFYNSISFKTKPILAETFRYNLSNNNIFIGSNTYLDGLIYTRENGMIQIGDNCSFRSNTLIGSLSKIIIGNNVFGAENVFICDNNNHPISPKLRKLMTLSPPNTEPWKWNSSDVDFAPIIIADNVWIGRNVMILKGVEIGEGSIVAAGAVVTKSFPSYTIIGGNPARVLKKIPIDS